MSDQPNHSVILVVDDQEPVRALLRRQLTDLGHTVLESGDGAEALHLVRRRNGAVDLLLCDVVMPRMAGPELAHRLLHTRPEMKVLYTSGYTADALSDRGVLEDGIAFLQKPFRLDALAAKVHQVLSTPSRPVRE